MTGKLDHGSDQDIQLAEKQLEEGLGINHKDAKIKSMTRFTE